MQHINIQSNFLDRFNTPAPVRSLWDEQCKRFEATKKISVRDRKTKQLRPATAAEIGKRLGMARFKDSELDWFYKECERARNFGAFFNYYVKERTPRCANSTTSSATGSGPTANTPAV
jgi:hypothetical protein